MVVVHGTEIRHSTRDSRRRPVVVAIDLGDGSETLIRAARGMSAGGPLLLVHVVRNLSDIFRPYLCSVPLQRLQVEIALEGKAWLGRLRRECAADLPGVRELVLEGTPWSELVETARRNDAELIVVGATSRWNDEEAGGASPSVLSSTAARVVRFAPCAVMVVPIATEDPDHQP